LKTGEIVHSHFVNFFSRAISLTLLILSAEHRDAYDLRLFLGFDRYRIVESDFDANTGEKKETKNASLYFYSRMSGRLIKSEPDARHMLGLSTGTSLYAAALTIIIDDVDGNLPLHPTKQDLAFGNENRGAVHEENLLAWVGAGKIVNAESRYLFECRI